MNRIAFLQKVASAIDFEGTLESGQLLADIETWDSLAILSVIDLLAEIGVETDIDALAAAKTTDDLLTLAGRAIDE
jgi:hypothetical protein